MSLVAYASSEEESDAEEAAGEEEEAAAPLPAAAQQPPARGLFATLPPPKAPAMPPLPPPGSGFPLLPPPLHAGPPPPFLMGPPPGVRGFGTSPPAISPAQASAGSLPEPAAGGDGSGERPRLGGLLLPPPRNAAATTTAASALSLPPPASASAALPGAGVDLSLPKPKKRTEPVRIAAPELHKGDVSMEPRERTPPWVGFAREAQRRFPRSLPSRHSEVPEPCLVPLLWCLRGDSSQLPGLILKRFAELNWYRNLIYNHKTANRRLSAPLFITEVNELMMGSCMALHGGIPQNSPLMFAVQAIDFPVGLLLIYLKASGVLQTFR